MAAVIAVVFGEQVGIAAAVLLTAIAAGIVLASSWRPRRAAVRGARWTCDDPGRATRPATRAGRALPAPHCPPALGGVVCFGINLYASARIGATLPLVWSSCPPGSAACVRGPAPARDRPTAADREAAPFVIVVTLAEVVGTRRLCLRGPRRDRGRRRDVLPVRRDRRPRIGRPVRRAVPPDPGVGVVVIAVGVATLAALHGDLDAPVGGSVRSRSGWR